MHEKSIMRKLLWLLFGLILSINVLTGQELLKDINSTELYSARPKHLTVVGNTLFFSAAANAYQGRELWKTGGTTASLVKDIRPGDPGTARACAGSPIRFSPRTVDARTGEALTMRVFAAAMLAPNW